MARKQKASADAKRIEIRCDENGVSLSHGEVSLHDLKRAWGALGCVILHNDYLNGAMPKVRETFEIMEETAAQYLADLVLDELHGSQIGRIESDVGE